MRLALILPVLACLPLPSLAAATCPFDGVLASQVERQALARWVGQEAAASFEVQSLSESSRARGRCRDDRCRAAADSAHAQRMVKRTEEAKQAFRASLESMLAPQRELSSGACSAPDGLPAGCAAIKTACSPAALAARALDAFDAGDRDSALEAAEAVMDWLDEAGEARLASLLAGADPAVRSRLAAAGVDDPEAARMVVAGLAEALLALVGPVDPAVGGFAPEATRGEWRMEAPEGVQGTAAPERFAVKAGSICWRGVCREADYPAGDGVVYVLVGRPKMEIHVRRMYDGSLGVSFDGRQDLIRYVRD
jgi:hypothetical protein